jgi:hypothetical protein
VRRRSWGWTLVLVAAALVGAGGFVISFRDEPSAVGRVETALVAIGVSLIAVGVAGGIAGVWMLITRRT